VVGLGVVPPPPCAADGAGLGAAGSGVDGATAVDAATLVVRQPVSVIVVGRRVRPPSNHVRDSNPDPTLRTKDVNDPSADAAGAPIASTTPVAAAEVDSHAVSRVAIRARR